MDELTKLFSDFENQVTEITSHAQQVHKIDFSAKLMNGTIFSFRYNSDTFNREEKGKQPYSPASVFNAVVDIVGAVTSLVLLIYLCVFIHNHHLPFDRSASLIILSYSFFICCFVLTALFHLFNKESPARLVFYNVMEACKVLALGTANIGIALLTDPITMNPILLATLLVGATALLLLSAGTQVGAKASLAFTTLLPYLPLYAKLSFTGLTTATLFGLWSLVAIIAKPSLRVKSNTTFALIGVLALGINFTMLLY